MGAKQSLHVVTDGAPGVALGDLRIDELYFCASNFFNVSQRGVINREFLVARLEYAPHLPTQHNRPHAQQGRGEARAAAPHSRSQSPLPAHRGRRAALETSDSCSSHHALASVNATADRHQWKQQQQPQQQRHGSTVHCTASSPGASPRSCPSEYSDCTSCWGSVSEPPSSSSGPSSPRCCSSSSVSGRTSDSHSPQHAGADAAPAPFESVLFCPSFGHWASESCLDPLDLLDIPSPLASPGSPRHTPTASWDASVPGGILSSLPLVTSEPLVTSGDSVASLGSSEVGALHSPPACPACPHLADHTSVAPNDSSSHRSLQPSRDPISASSAGLDWSDSADLSLARSPAVPRLRPAGSADCADGVFFSAATTPAAHDLSSTTSSDFNDGIFTSALASLATQRLSRTVSLGSDGGSSVFHSALGSPASPHLSPATSIASSSLCPSSPRTPAAATHHHHPASPPRAGTLDKDSYNFFASLRTDDDDVEPSAASLGTSGCFLPPASLPSPPPPSSSSSSHRRAAAAVEVARLDLTNLWATASVSERGDSLNVWLHSTAPPPSFIGDAFSFASCPGASPTLQDLVDMCCKARARWVLHGVMDSWRVARQVFHGLLTLYRRRAMEHKHQRDAVERTLRAFRTFSKTVYVK